MGMQFTQIGTSYFIYCAICLIGIFVALSPYFFKYIFPIRHNLLIHNGLFKYPICCEAIHRFQWTRLLKIFIFENDLI